MNKKTINKAILTSIVLSLVSNNSVQAVRGSYDEAMEIRRLLTTTTPYLQKVSLAKIQQGGQETIVLPVSRGFNQNLTGLCWAYSALNALETIYMVRNPEGQKIELSRRAMQYYTMEDRYRRLIKNVNTHLNERGVALDAIRLIQSNGIVSFDDYFDIIDPYGQADIREMINSADNFTDKINAMYKGMDIFYKTPPTLSHIPSSPTLDNPDPAYVEAKAGDLARLVLAGDVWQSYAPSETKVGFHDHPDSDSRWENKSWYMPRGEFPGRIKQALKAGFPVIVTIRGHTVMVYGADYNSNGSPVTYYIKDSYPSHTPENLEALGGSKYIKDYYFLAEADNLHEILLEMTTIKL
jgi:hypothetical protein